MYGRLIVLGKQPGICPVRVVETWRRLFDKIVLKVTVSEAASICQDYHICTRLKAVIDGSVREVQDIWDTKSTREDWGFMIVDSKTCSTISIK